MPTPNDMPPRKVPLRIRVARILDAVCDQIDAEGPMPGGSPHPLLADVPELMNAVTQAQRCNLEHQRERNASD
jgi:hypothetical protein